MPRTPRQLLECFQQAMLDFSPDALADLFAEDAVYEFPFLAPQREAGRYEGREQIRAGFTRAWSSPHPSPVVGLRDVRVHETADPELIIAEHEFDAVNHATGESFTSGFVLILRARGGQIVDVRDYADVLRLSAGLGRLPQLFEQLRGTEQM
ncbi:nuclear transport factor 2 family protein [Streptomyces noursei]|uniref:nuclear transport factor 2 family protein n=1 Tax=Streptomyces noursei TaxID=1971 RepID=UPI0019664392|nr:nuclear transport factor 2 family protein [Streptomyces noursei]QRX96541.1 nuclear transport factor 2 family protein [Streptomyces noursei]